jgi:hypothetical protein
MLIAALAILALAYVAAPLRFGAAEESQVEGRPVEEARSRKRAALSALLELDEDAEMGKISTADLVKLRATYEMEAVMALIQLDDAEADPADDDELEVEIKALRKRMQCPSCGAVRSPGEPCPRCGA